jgi:hypothetical protein
MLLMLVLRLSNIRGLCRLSAWARVFFCMLLR